MIVCICCARHATTAALQAWAIWELHRLGGFHPTDPDLVGVTADDAKAMVNHLKHNL